MVSGPLRDGRQLLRGPWLSMWAEYYHDQAEC